MKNRTILIKQISFLRRVKSLQDNYHNLLFMFGFLNKWTFFFFGHATKNCTALSTIMYIESFRKNLIKALLFTGCERLFFKKLALCSILSWFNFLFPLQLGVITALNNNIYLFHCPSARISRKRSRNKTKPSPDCDCSIILGIH